MLPEPRGLVRSSISSTNRILAAAFFFLIAPGAFPAARNADLPPLSTQTYDAASFIQELNILKSELETTRKSPFALRAFRDSLPQSWTVKSGEQQYEVPTSPFVSRLSKAENGPADREQQLDEARDFLDALSVETASLSGSPRSDSASAKTKLGRILERPEFATKRQQSWWERFHERINEMIYDALLRLLGRMGGQQSLGEALLWIGVCAAAVLIAYWVFRRWFRAARLEEIALEAAGVPARSWQEWVYASRDAAARSDYRLAIHCAYWAAIARMEDIGALPADKAKTPREYLRTLTKAKLLVPESQSTRYQALSMLTSRLERTWYGYHVATETDFRDSLAQLEVLGCHLP